MKTKHLILFSPLLFLILISCKSNSGDSRLMQQGEGMAKMESVDDSPSPPAQETVIVVPDSTRKIIRDGRMEIRVKNLEQGKHDVDTLVKRYHGYYADETFNNMDYAHGYTLRIRIPSVSFDAFIAEIESGVGEVAFKNITSRDVTEEYIDLETRLKNKRNYLIRYGDLLKQAGSVKDILEIAEKTRLIEEEVESVQGRLKYLNHQVDFSTLELQISRKNDFSVYTNNKGRFVDRLKLSLVKGWYGLVSFTLFVIRLWPFWIIVGVLYYLIKTIIRKRKKLR